MMFSDPFFPFASQSQRASAFLPAADVTVSESDLVLTLDVPGVSADDLSIELLDGHLVVRGARRRPEVAEDATWVHVERGFGEFERQIKVPDGVDPDRIMASVDNGVLSLIVPKPERLKPRTITIGTSERQQRELETTSA